MDRTGGFKPLDVLLNQKYLSLKEPQIFEGNQGEGVCN